MTFDGWYNLIDQLTHGYVLHCEPIPRHGSADADNAFDLAALSSRVTGRNEIAQQDGYPEIENTILHRTIYCFLGHIRPETTRY
jgi:hypothetical protein